MKKTSAVGMFLSLGLLSAPCVYAIELLELFQQIKPAANSKPEQVQAGREKILSMMVGCELNDKCMLLMLTEVVKNDPDPTYKAFLTLLQSQTDKIEHDAIYCDNEAMQTVRQAKTACVASAMGKMNQMDAEDDAMRLEGDMNNCLKDSMEKLAIDGNIFAQNALLNYNKRIKNPLEVIRWDTVVNAQKGTPQYKALQKCLQPAVDEMPEPAPSAPTPSAPSVPATTPPPTPTNAPAGAPPTPATPPPSVPTVPTVPSLPSMPVEPK